MTNNRTFHSSCKHVQLSFKTQVKKWVGIPVGSHWDPNRDPGGIYRDKNSGSRLGSRRDPTEIPVGSRPNPDGMLAGFSGIRPGYSRDPVGIHWDPVGIHRDPIGIHWDPSGIKTRDFAGSRRYPDGIPLGSHPNPDGIYRDPSGIKTRDFAGSRSIPTGSDGIPSDPDVTQLKSRP